MRLLLCLVAPANAGVHNHRCLFSQRLEPRLGATTSTRGYGSLRSQGRRKKLAVPAFLKRRGDQRTVGAFGDIRRAIEAEPRKTLLVGRAGRAGQSPPQ